MLPIFKGIGVFFFGMLRDRKNLSWEGVGAVCRRCLVRGLGARNSFVLIYMLLYILLLA